VLDDLMEWAGLALLVVFAGLIWLPAAVGTAAVILVVVANLRSVARRRAANPTPARDPWPIRAARAVAVFRQTS
jgi:hypothetical protein